MAEDKFEHVRRGLWCDVFMHSIKAGGSSAWSADAANVALAAHDEAFPAVPAKKLAVKKAKS